MRACYPYRLVITLMTVLIISLFGQGAWSQTSRTIKIIVPFSAGGGADIVARQLADQISHMQGLTVLVENRPGAGSVIATETVSRADPDGSTLLLPANSFVINPHLKKLSYDP